jgi:hypothetical protein
MAFSLSIADFKLLTVRLLQDDLSERVPPQFAKNFDVFLCADDQASAAAAIAINWLSICLAQ